MNKTFNKNSFLYYILPFIILLDVFYIFIPSSIGIVKSPLAILKAFVITVFFILNLVNNKIDFSNDIKSIFIFSFYLILSNIFLASDHLVSFKGSLSALLPILLYTIAKSNVKSNKQLIKINNSMLFFAIILILNMVLSNIFNIGESDYTYSDDYEAGSLHDSYNVFTYSLLVLPILGYFSTKKEKKIIFIIGIILFILLILTLKRIAILGALLGFILYFFFLGNFTKNLKRFTFIGIILLIASPFYYDLLLSRFEVRFEKGTFTNEFYEKEARYLETYFVWNKILSFDDAEFSIFGKDPFDTVGKYGQNIDFGLREIHVDYNKIVYTLGLLGLFLYLFFHWQIYAEFSKSKSFANVIPHYKILKATFLVLLIMSLFTSIAGQMQHIAFRSIIFIYLGSINGILSFNKKILLNEKN